MDTIKNIVLMELVSISLTNIDFRLVLLIAVACCILGGIISWIRAKKK